MDRATLPHIGVIVRANREIGTGHLMRIKPLLPKIKEHAYLTLYVYAFDTVLSSLCSEYDEVLTFKTKEDILCHLKDLICLQNKENKEHGRLDDLFIIDDYAIDKSFEEQLYPYSKIFVIDDLANRHHQCHMLLDQTLITRQSTYQKLCPKDCTLLLGATYSLTKECFYPQYFDFSHQSSCSCLGHALPFSARSLHLASSAQGKQLDTPHVSLPRVLVNFGGADPVSACVITCRSIIEAKLYLDYEFYILTGQANKDLDKIKALIDTLEPQYHNSIKLITHCNDVADLLYRFDFAIGAYGGMFRERIAAAIPTIGVEIADNQAGAMQIVEKYNIGTSLTLEELSHCSLLANALSNLKQHGQEYTNNCQVIYDGQGLNRIAHKILSLIS